VINLSGDDMLLSVSVELRNTFECHIVAFGGTTGENDLFSLGSNHIPDLSSCLLTGHLGVPSVLMGFGVRVSEIIS